ncbi:hypothetical protein ACFFQW_20655 [Umezawaea endophytica]|uniref:Uncharacterized protein n=1 Tax=Umezawaea endophytica TaxID=1654476 RepID=A0A9X3AIL0_9PSEU|nr:hypothetical protein [Umezawaea endophytica]MCS7480645.1 hypothetical protein [Umezawaea endophytica]
MALSEPKPRAVRLIFEYEGREVRLVSSEAVDALVPPTDQLDGYDDHLGVWVEVRDADGRPLHRRVLTGPLEETVEVLADDSGPSLRRTRVTGRRGGFAVLVPGFAEADHLSFLSGVGSTARAEGATELARFPLGGGGGS